jgi:nucleoside-diphosphate-sugar epimerase
MDFGEGIEQHACDLEDITGLSAAWFHNADCVIHSAARAHVTSDESLKSLDEYRRINRDMTLNLARLASKCGVKRFIYLSSIKVNGEQTSSRLKFKPDDDFSSFDPYAISKYEAENGLLELASGTGMEVVIIRPPLVYGPNVKANFASMIKWVKRGIPLPFDAIKNKRSLIALENLLDFILLCADRARSPNAANQIFLISDGEDVSTSTLLRRVARAYGIKSRLLPVPVLLIRLGAKFIGKSDMSDRLVGNLQVDSSKAYKLLGWKPVVSMDEQLKKMANYEKRAKKS